MQQPATLAQVRELARTADSARAYSPLSAHRCLLLDGDSGGLAPAERAEVAAWLRQLPCPTLAIAREPHPDPVADACDVRLPDAAGAAPLLANIQHSPMAAAVLVQLLRSTEPMAVADALVVESLAYSTLQSGPEFRRWHQAQPAPAARPATDSGPAVVIDRDGDRLLLELNRPASRNGMSVEMRDALVEALQLVLTDTSIRSVRLSGRGKCFSTGGDLTEFGTAPDPATAHIVRSLTVPGRYLAACAARVEAHVHGACIGSGIEFPAFAGRVTAAPDAYFQLPELRFGLIPGAGGCVSIPRRIGRQRTAWLALSGRRIPAAQALQWGLVDAISG